MKKVKIVCTIGPASSHPAMLVRLIDAGMDAARLNFSHGSHDEHRRMFESVREASAKVGRPVAIIGDLCGPKIRVGEMPENGLKLENGKEFKLIPESMQDLESGIPHSYPALAKDIAVGDPILLDDGLIRMTATAIDGHTVTARVEVGGVLKSHKGMNLPESKLSTPALTEKDKRDLAFACDLGVDYLALSFVRSSEDVKQAKALAGDTPVLAKIEKPEAVENLDAILDVADGAMVARGDLGVEVGHEKVPLIQKRIIGKMRPRAKPVITATQMLDSMTRNPTPTRAEVSDVANSVLDGTDALMLSGETAVGSYPIETVQTMSRIIREIEASDLPANGEKPLLALDKSFSSAVAEAVTSASREFDIAAVAVYTQSGRSAALVSAERPDVHLIAFSPHAKVLARLALFWGVRPIYGEWVNDVRSITRQAETVLVNNKLVVPGDNIAITFGIVLEDEEFQTNMMKLWKVRERRDMLDY